MKLFSPLALSWALQLSVDGCLLAHERAAIAGRASQRIPPATREGTGYPIGKGDRFRQGSIAPQGLGTKDRSLESILNIDEIASGLEALAASFPGVRLFDAPHKTFENRTVRGAVFGADSPRAFIQAGVHARERGGPDNVLYFAADLLAAARDGAGLAYGNQSYTAAQVRAALSAGVVVVPLINPDGVHYDQQTGQCWRKNRNPRSGSADGRGWGVDLNRNYDFLWDTERAFDPSVRRDDGALGSEDPASELFHGTAPASEPEVQNAQWVMAQHGNLSWFLDLHSVEGDVLYAWGDDETQTADPAQSFANPKYDGVRGLQGDGAYGEYMEPADLASQRGLAERICAATANAGSVEYTAKRSSGLYPSSGTSTDYALSRYYGHECGASRINGLGIEFGRPSEYECGFYPSEEQYHESMRQVGAALMEFLLTAAGPEGEPKHWKC